MNLDRIIKKVIREEQHSTRYMFFSNLEQMKRQCESLLEMDESKIESILEHGHDWAQDHIAEAKNNMDQVFDFIMNEVNGEGDDSYEKEDDDEMIEEGKKKTGSKLCARGKAAAKSKFDVYPSAYANGFAAKDYKAKGGGWRKCK
jgi:division protein CdvB (Snf7/Vps24/ESCRT-III family)